MAGKRFWSDFVGKLTSLVASDKIMVSDSEDTDIVKYTDFSTLESSINHNNIAGKEFAGDGVVFGHIANISQTIYGNKTFINDLIVNGNIIAQFDLTVQGNLYINGTQSIVNTQTVEVKDNILLINNGEVGAGVTAGTAGIEVDRGTLTNYQFIFDETSGTFKIGEISSLQEVATREVAPINGSVAIWDDINTKFKTVSANTLISGLNADKIDGYDINQDLLTTASPTFQTIKLTNLTDGYIPFHGSDTLGLVDSIISQNANGIGIGTITGTEQISLYKYQSDNGIRIQGSSSIWDIINQYSNGGALALLQSEVSQLSLSKSGLLKLGNGNATEKLDVDGNIKVAGNMLKMTGISTTVRDSLTAVAGDIIYNTTTNKHQGFNGTIWNDLY